MVLQQLLMALDFLHSECHLIHTGESTPVEFTSFLAAVSLTRLCADLKMDNMMFGAGDDAIFHEFEQQELENPSPRKEVDGRFIYVSRELDIPEDLAVPVLCDFGSVVTGDQTNTKDVQPSLYRAPEVILQVPWSYEIDIWNVGCMVGMPLPCLLEQLC
jgi:serine/threonine protein kinase